MPDVTIYHNRNCSTSKKALAAAEELGVEVDVVEYLKRHPDRAALEGIVDRLEDPVADLVRKDPLFTRLGLDPADYTEPEAVIELLLEEPALMQRPVLVKGDRAIIGRPPARVPGFLSD